MKLWSSNEKQIDQLIENFTIGKDQLLDIELARYDVIGSIAHAKMLASIDLISKPDLSALEKELNNILNEINEGNFKIDKGFEDIHSQIESLLVQRIGDVGKKLHTGRSRNDQVLLDLRLYFRDKLDGLSEGVNSLIYLFSALSQKNKKFLMPGYTHMQIGMVSSFGMWFGCFAEALIDDYHQLKGTRKYINQNPLGSAAGYGNSFPLDRQKTTDLLGFDKLCYNSMYAQFGRGKSELRIAQSISSLAYTLSKFVMDVCLFSNQHYKLVTLPDYLITGSSIMPHKRNPDVFELIRARCNQLMSLPTEILMICQNLPSGYHRDYQQLKESIFPAFRTIDDVVKILIHALPQIQINEASLNDEKYDLLYSVEEINKLVLNGIPFRTAYHEIKKQINDGSFKPDRKLNHSHIGSIGNLGNKEILEKLKE